MNKQSLLINLWCCCVFLQFPLYLVSAPAYLSLKKQPFPQSVFLLILIFQGHLNTYRFCDNVWTFVLTSVDFRDLGEIVKADKVKVVACDGKGKTFPGK